MTTGNPDPVVRLRPAEPSDFERMRQWMNKPEIHRWLDTVFQGGISVAQYQILLARSDKNRLFVIVLDDEPVGVVGFTDIDTQHASAEVWYAVGEVRAWGRGVGRSAVEQGIEWAMQALNVQTLHAWVVNGNEPSMRILTGIGFQQAGTLRSAFRFETELRDRVFFDLTRADWVRARGANVEARSEIRPKATVSECILRTRTPPLVQLASLVKGVKGQRKDVVDFGQAVPNYGPPEVSLRHMTAELSKLATHQYTCDEGLPSLRATWAAVLRSRFDLHPDPERELLITAGANQAYLMAAQTLVGPGERMAIISPWYFNHAMAIEMIGGRIVEIHARPELGYQLDPDEVVRIAQREKVKAVTLVNPNNPTGITYDADTIRELVTRLVEAGLYVIVDETYAFFAEPEHFSAGSLETGPEGVVTIGSFSKTFAMTGWRIGYIVASASLLQEMMKIQDTMIICASHPGQVLVEACLDTAWDWLEERRKDMAARARCVTEAADTFGPWKLEASGPFFAFLRGPGSSREAALRLLHEHGVVTTPGESFGSGLEQTLRLALGNIEAAQLPAALSRLAAGLRTCTG